MVAASDQPGSEAHGINYGWLGASPMRRATYRRPAGFALWPFRRCRQRRPACQALLLLGRSCPWAHRAWLVWALRQLQDRLVLVVEPDSEGPALALRTPSRGAEA